MLAFEDFAVPVEMWKQIPIAGAMVLTAYLITRVEKRDCKEQKAELRASWEVEREQRREERTRVDKLIEQNERAINVMEKFAIELEARRHVSG